MSGMQSTTTSPDVDLHLEELHNADSRIRATRLTFMGQAGFSATFSLSDRDLARFSASINDYLKHKADRK